MAVIELERGELPAALPDEAIEAEVRSLAAEIAAATCRFLLLIAELDRREAWRRWECVSCAHWLSWQCGISLRTSREHVRVGRSLAALPRITDAFASGQLSFSKVRALTRVATSETETELLALAREATAAHLDRIVSGYERARRLATPDLALAQLRRRALWSTHDDDGMVTTSVRLAPEAHAILWSALEAALEQLPDPTDEPDQPGPARRADAFEHLAREYLAPGATESPPTNLVTHIDVETLVADRPGRSEVEGGPGLCAETARRLACDAGLTVSVEQAGTTLDVGRRTRTIPPALRRAVVDRDRGTCRWPSCANTRHLQVHHRIHWARGGPTNKANSLLVCPFHHRALHEGGWSADGDPDASLTFVGPKGQRIPELPIPLPTTDPGALRRRRIRSGGVLRRGASVALWKGESLDLDHAVTAMACLLPNHDRRGRDLPDGNDGHD